MKSARGLLAIALIGYAAISFSGIKIPDLSKVFEAKPEAPVAATPIVSEPPQSVKDSLKPMLELAKDDPVYRKALSDYFITFGMAVKEGVIATDNPATLREVNSSAGALYAKRLGLTGKHKGINDVINATLESLLGKSGDKITPERRSQIADVFIHMGWAFGQ